MRSPGMHSFKNRQISCDDIKTPDLSVFRCQIGDDNSLALEKRVRKFLKVGVFGLALSNRPCKIKIQPAKFGLSRAV